MGQAKTVGAGKGQQRNSRSAINDKCHGAVTSTAPGATRRSAPRLKDSLEVGALFSTDAWSDGLAGGLAGWRAATEAASLS